MKNVTTIRKLRCRHLACLYGIFVLLAVGRVSATPMDDPNTATALQEMQAMVQAQTDCAGDTGYYVALETLNDTTSPGSGDPAHDDLGNEGGTFAIDPATGRFLAGRVDLSTGGWDGPYLTYASDSVQTDPDPYDVGSPLDPWGNAYYLFTPLGLARGDMGENSFELLADRFDRFTILSLGSDGARGGGDDLIHAFGDPPNAMVLSSLQGDAVQTDGTTWFAEGGTDLAVRGYGLGDAQAAARLLFGETEFDAITDWSDTRIGVRLPLRIGEDGGGEILDELAVERAPDRGSGLTLQILFFRNAVRGWMLFE